MKNVARPYPGQNWPDLQHCLEERVAHRHGNLRYRHPVVVVVVGGGGGGMNWKKQMVAT